MTEKKLGKIVDPKTIRINPRHLVPGDTMKLPEGMTFEETDSPPHGLTPTPAPSKPKDKGRSK